MAKLISVIPARSGCGATTVAANLAAVLAEAGRKVCLVDGCVEQAFHRPIFSMEAKEIPFTFTDFLEGKCELEKTLVRVHDECLDSLTGQVDMISASRWAVKVNRELQASFDINRLNIEVQSLVAGYGYEFVILDLEGDLSGLSLVMMAMADWNLVVSGIQEMQEAAVIVDMAKSLDVANRRLVINKMPERFDAEQSAREFEKSLDCPVGAILPNSDDVLVERNAAVFALRFPAHPVSLGIRKLAGQLMK